MTALWVVEVYCWGTGAAGWDGGGGVKDIFCLMSSSTACRIAMFWAI